MKKECTFNKDMRDPISSVDLKDVLTFADFEKLCVEYQILSQRITVMEHKLQQKYNENIEALEDLHGKSLISVIKDLDKKFDVLERWLKCGIKDPSYNPYIYGGSQK
jgi:hypothetical protein